MKPAPFAPSKEVGKGQTVVTTPDNLPISSEDFAYLRPINDQLLADLGWDYGTASFHLISRFGVSSRKALTYGQFWAWTLFCESCLDKKIPV